MSRHSHLAVKACNLVGVGLPITLIFGKLNTNAQKSDNRPLIQYVRFQKESYDPDCDSYTTTRFNRYLIGKKQDHAVSSV